MVFKAETQADIFLLNSAPEAEVHGPPPPPLPEDEAKKTGQKEARPQAGEQEMNAAAEAAPPKRKIVNKVSPMPRGDQNPGPPVLQACGINSQNGISNRQAFGMWK